MTQGIDAAFAAYQAGDFAGAAQASRDLLAARPGEEGPLVLLAMAEHAGGRFPEAADAFRALTALRPQVPEYWSNLGLALRLAGRQAEAEGAFRHGLDLAPRAYGLLFNYGLLLLDMHRYGAARHRFLDAYEADPGSAEARIYGAIACFECGDTDRAEALIPPPATWSALEPELHYHLALVLMQLGRAEEAERLLDPGTLAQADTRTLASLAVLQERTNRLKQAQALLERIRAHPDSGSREVRIDALTVESLLALRRGDVAGARNATEELLSLGLSAAGEASACFTLGAVADKEGKPAEAMEALARAHAIQLRFAEEIAPEIALSDEEPLRISLPRMTPPQCRFPADPGAPAADASPVFIVGFPRSGTTMLEQMLDAHPGYVSMDEQPILERCVDQARACGIGYPEELGALDPAQLARIRGFYREAVARVARLAPGQVLVDKNPLNILRLPMIRRLFPNARIILALRHPCDVMLSCYMQDFRSPVFRVLCSSLERLARSYVNTMRFWIHHQDLLQANVLELRYEDTVSDFPSQVERIGRFLEVEDWTPFARFSEHARRKAYIGTPSYSQVVQPVNTGSVSRWLQYRPWFEPVLPVLRPIAEHWGYDLPTHA